MSLSEIKEVLKSNDIVGWVQLTDTRLEEVYDKLKDNTDLLGRLIYGGGTTAMIRRVFDTYPELMPRDADILAAMQPSMDTFYYIALHPYSPFLNVERRTNISGHSACNQAAYRGDIEMLRVLMDTYHYEYDKYNTCAWAACSGQLVCLQWLVEERKCQWKPDHAYDLAKQCNHAECMDYIRPHLPPSHPDAVQV